MARLQRLILIIGALVMLLIFVDWVSTSPERIPCGYRCLSYDYHISKLIGGILGTGAVTALLYFAFSSNKNKELDSNNLQTKHKHKIFDFSKRRSLISSIIISLLIYFGIWLIFSIVIPLRYLDTRLGFSHGTDAGPLSMLLPKAVLIIILQRIIQKRGLIIKRNSLILLVIFFVPFLSLFYLPWVLSKDSNLPSKENLSNVLDEDRSISKV